MNERITHLQIKIKSLAAESRIIRQQARKTDGMVKWELNHHRTSVVRVHSRHSLLAYGLLRDIPYSAIEQYCACPPNWKQVERTAERFGANTEIVSKWIEAAKDYIKQPSTLKLELAS